MTGDPEEYGNDLDGRDMRDYQSCIHEALLENQFPEEKGRGLMRWYDKQDGVNMKVQSVVFDVESDEIYCDLQDISGNIARLSPEYKDNLIKRLQILRWLPHLCCRHIQMLIAAFSYFHEKKVVKMKALWASGEWTLDPIVICRRNVAEFSQVRLRSIDQHFTGNYSRFSCRR